MWCLALYIISQSDVGHDALYCSNIKHQYLYCVCVLVPMQVTFSHTAKYVLVNSPTTLGPGHQVHGSHLHWPGQVQCLELL